MRQLINCYWQILWVSNSTGFQFDEIDSVSVIVQFKSVNETHEL